MEGRLFNTNVGEEFCNMNVVIEADGSPNFITTTGNTGGIWYDGEWHESTITYPIPSFPAFPYVVPEIQPQPIATEPIEKIIEIIKGEQTRQVPIKEKSKRMLRPIVRSES